MSEETKRERFERETREALEREVRIREMRADLKESLDKLIDKLDRVCESFEKEIKKETKREREARIKREWDEMVERESKNSNWVKKSLTGERKNGEGQRIDGEEG